MSEALRAAIDAKYVADDAIDRNKRALGSWGFVMLPDHEQLEAARAKDPAAYDALTPPERMGHAIYMRARAAHAEAFVWRPDLELDLEVRADGGTFTGERAHELDRYAAARQLAKAADTLDGARQRANGRA